MLFSIFIFQLGLHLVYSSSQLSRPRPYTCIYLCIAYFGLLKATFISLLTVKSVLIFLSHRLSWTPCIFHRGFKFIRCRLAFFPFFSELRPTLVHRVQGWQNFTDIPLIFWRVMVFISGISWTIPESVIFSCCLVPAPFVSAFVSHYIFTGAVFSWTISIFVSTIPEKHASSLVLMSFLACTPHISLFPFSFSISIRSQIDLLVLFSGFQCCNSLRSWHFHVEAICTQLSCDSILLQAVRGGLPPYS